MRQHLEELISLGLSGKDIVNLLGNLHFGGEPIPLTEWEIVAPKSHEEFEELATLKDQDIYDKNILEIGVWLKGCAPNGEDALFGEVVCQEKDGKIECEVIQLPRWDNEQHHVLVKRTARRIENRRLPSINKIIIWNPRRYTVISV